MKVPLANLKEGPIRHRNLPDDLLRRIRAFKEILAEVDTTPLADVIDDFRRDVHPEREIAVWEHIANAYQLFLAAHPTAGLLAKHAAFSVLLTASLGMDYRNIPNLTQEQITELVLNYRRF